MPSPSASLLSPDEPERLASLRAHHVLTALVEPVFDAFVALAAQVFSLPISLIAVVEEADVYYPNNYGMPGNSRQPRAEALCSTAVQQARAVVYHDLLLETSAAIPPEAARAAAENKLRFYAGALLRLPDQRPLGTLCIIDRQPRTFSSDEQQLLDQLAALVSQAIAVRHTCRLSAGGAAQWQEAGHLLQQELLEVAALARYLFTRHGVQIPVAADLLGQVRRRLNDLQALLADYQPEPEA